MALSKGGLIGCAIYAVFCAVLFVVQFFIVDVKTSVFVTIIAAFPAEMLIHLSGLRTFPSGEAGSYLLFALSFLVVYCAGWAIGAIARWMERLE